VTGALNENDYVASTHRGHGHLIAKGGDLNRMMAELYGRATGYCRGKGGSMHVADMEIGMLGANGIVGGGIPIATGAGLAAQYKGSDRVSVSFFGDAASNRGTFHEAVNLAAVWNLPVVYVCENNHWGVSTCQARHMKLVDIADRGAAYGIPGMVVDGNDVVAVYEAAVLAVERARIGEGPTILECKTWRHFGHFVGDPCAYYDPEEHQRWLDRDPLQLAAQDLLAKGYAAQAEFDALRDEVRAEVEAAVAFARSSPWPEPAALLTDVFHG
jgi:acetoin:2,6-dichlorophenolindophenol oxidoreductase subunit alpha